MLPAIDEICVFCRHNHEKMLLNETITLEVGAYFIKTIEAHWNKTKYFLVVLKFGFSFMNEIIVLTSRFGL